jgi:hypothetical protein
MTIDAFLADVDKNLELIATQEHAEEIRYEYQKTLNATEAITSVLARHKALAEAEALKAEGERKTAEAAAAKDVAEAQVMEQQVGAQHSVQPVQPVAPPVIQTPPTVSAPAFCHVVATIETTRAAGLVEYLQKNGIQAEIKE